MGRLSLASIPLLKTMPHRFGGFAYMQSAIAIMERMNGTAGGNILVTGATSSIRGRSGFAGFAASKGGLRQICQSVAREYGPKVRR